MAEDSIEESFLSYNSGFYIPHIHIGSCIDKWLSDNSMSLGDFAKRTSLLPASVKTILERETIDTSKLTKICIALNHNFYTEYLIDKKKYVLEFKNDPDIHIGQSIANIIKFNHVSQSAFARHLGVSQPEVSRILRKADIDTGKLVKISYLLKNNFFELFCITSAKFYETMPDLPEDKGSYDEYEELSLLNRYKELLVENDQLKIKVEKLRKQLIDSGLTPSV